MGGIPLTGEKKKSLNPRGVAIHGFRIAICQKTDEPTNGY
jgi:hypothetical protein